MKENSIQRNILVNNCKSYPFINFEDIPDYIPLEISQSFPSAVINHKKIITSLYNLDKDKSKIEINTIDKMIIHTISKLSINDILDSKSKKGIQFSKEKAIKIILKRKNNDKKLEKKIMGNTDENNLIEKNIEYLNSF